MLLATLYVALAARAGANVASRRGRVAFLARSVRTLPRGGEVRRFVTAARNPPPVSANRDPMRRMSDGPPGDGADTAPSYSARERDTWAATPQIFVTAAERELLDDGDDLGADAAAAFPAASQAPTAAAGRGGAAARTPRRLHEDVVEMISVGESANTLPTVLLGVARKSEKQSDRILGTLLKLLEPALLLFLAAAVVFIFLALVLPMMQLGSEL